MRVFSLYFVNVLFYTTLIGFCMLEHPF
jgi:hypothetical protein